ncbi:DUF5060 domain-containing protein [Confluentibacter lentus]|uniref:DUF5060 domain-containing protein n=1 Tax=Confluentibacter lentus TaxID=1699412 RepID=UPI000C289C68|nr:DUF5060 domain-containing protein [Confluentibacter lentus]
MRKSIFLKNEALVFLLFVITAYTVISCQHAEIQSVEQWGVYELSLEGASEGNPYMDNSLDAKFTNGVKTVTVPGFYDGDGVYKVRFSPDQLGNWNYTTESNLSELNNLKGTIKCVEPTENNHGPVKPVNTFYLEYADGTPFYSVGTTAYQWTSVKLSIQEKTIETLKEAPFNKMRMCFFPKNYRYGNDTDPWAYPFHKKDSLNDFAQPNYTFFKNFDKRVAQLMDMGIEADVILFHPYDKWGYSQMGKEMNEKYVRYMIARLSAYRNVWWSLANEWDIPRIKETIDWEGIGTLLQNEDPHQRLRGIHNWYHGEHHFYDHTRPWITHVSTQTYYFFNAIKWRNKYQKPVLFDEMRYEGNVPNDHWGRLSAEEMTSYFWQAGLSGVYGTHGETYMNDSDKETEVRWWAKGGTLMGDSPKRIAFFKSIMEETPIKEMKPKLVSLSEVAIPETISDEDSSGDLIEQFNNNIYILSKEGEYYLIYTKNSGQTIALNLPGSNNYHLEVIDTWNMKIGIEEVIRPGEFQYETKMTYTALRIIRKK